MKKIAYTILLLILVITLSACSVNYEKYAKKINRAAKNNNHYTYSEVTEDLGNPDSYQTNPFPDEYFPDFCIWNIKNSDKTLLIYFDDEYAVKAVIK